MYGRTITAGSVNREQHDWLLTNNFKIERDFPRLVVVQEKAIKGIMLSIISRKKWAHLYQEGIIDSSVVA
jgi:hypothetical protein